eukprot:CAMPEP_0172459028 /NCGR_PEP_ID=MMETSP1065-20121228/30640_1 /TAXON_ID=265537 /ORGANISM="Amphiprora paludosa, Strain CCMP125" /LENGTH=638 /DNA_ID=CAMNT_0013213565 /DNA_START=388 /DNA_END=2304 /DNA_ORIENTATION=+
MDSEEQGKITKDSVRDIVKAKILQGSELSNEDVESIVKDAWEVINKMSVSPDMIPYLVDSELSNEDVEWIVNNIYEDINKMSLSLSDARQMIAFGAKNAINIFIAKNSEIAMLNAEISLRKRKILEQESNLLGSIMYAGKGIRSVGTGLTTSDSELEEQLPKKFRDVTEKGAKLTHPFYRSFLGRVDQCESKIQNHNHLLEPFLRCYNACFEKENVGITKDKNTTDHILSCPETVVSSIIGGAINQFLCHWFFQVDEKKKSETKQPSLKILWCSEVEMKNEMKERQPRSDGVLCILDGDSLRGLVCGEHKIGQFDEKGNLEAYANAIDIAAQKASDSFMIPVTSLRVSFLDKEELSFSLYGLVPIKDEKTLASVLLLKGDSITAYLACLAALAEAAIETWDNNLLTDQRWGSYHENLAFCPDNHVYKYFPQASKRNPNLELVRAFTDKQAELLDVANGDRVLKMKCVGRVVGDEGIPASRFAVIGKELQRLHGMGFVHCDIRFHNLLLEGITDEPKARLIDFDVARKEGEMYLSTLLPIQDGQRHASVSEAIKEKKLGTLPVHKDHDWFSLKEVMNLFEAVEKDHESKWLSMMNEIHTGGWTGDMSFEVRLKDIAKDHVWPGENNSIDATGSPKKNNH